MINIAARATNGIKIPDCRHTQQAIINKFKQQLAALRDRLNVQEILQHSYFFSNILLKSDRVMGKVSLTCDAWQVRIVAGYPGVFLGNPHPCP